MPVTRRHVTMALRAGGATVLFAVALELLWFLIYGLPRPEHEFVSLAIWTPLLGVFLAFYALLLGGLLERGPRFAVAMALGAAGGITWLIVASVQKGLWIAWLDTPVFAIWPLAAALGVAAVAPRPGRRIRVEKRPWRSVGFGLAGLAVFTLALKTVPPSWLGPELRHYTLGTIPTPPPSSTRTATAQQPTPELGSGDAPLTLSCRDPAPRPLPLDPVVVDSSSVARPVGEFTDRRERELGGRRHVYGRTLTLWSVEGSLTGALESRAGPAEDRGKRAVLEFARLDDVTGSLTFDAYFEDGFVSRFQGFLRDDSVEGVLETMDADCVTRVMATDTVVLRREGGPAEPPPTFRGLASRLAASGAFRRERPDLDGVFGRSRFQMAGDRWPGATTAAMYFTARFPSRGGAVAALDLDQVVSAYGRTVALRDILYGVRIGSSGYAEWMVVAPGGILGAYGDQAVERAREASATDLRHRVVHVLPCCRGG